MNVKLIKSIFLLLLGFCSLQSVWAENKTLTKTGDALQILIPLAAAAYSYHANDLEGVKELGYTWAATMATTEVLKNTVHETRPHDTDKINFDGKRDSFPSGHTASAFAGAWYIEERYGWKTAAPFLLGAVLTGASRIDNHEHHFHDVASSAAISYGFAKLFTTSRSSASVSIDRNGFQLIYSKNY
jgi:membrane-associated phospholipid phosphatase